MNKDVKKNLPVIIVSVLAVVVGVLGGFGLRQGQSPGQKVTIGSGDSQVSIQTEVTDISSVKAGDVFGSPNANDFKDQATGYLAAGGLSGEGSHHLLRPGGASQTVYLTSSATDLEKLVGMEVEVSGETFTAQKAGWLMDVGRVKVINPQATAPDTK